MVESYETDICGHSKEEGYPNGECDFWGCPPRWPKAHKYHVAVFDSATGELLGWRPLSEPKIDEETRAVLDGILKEANEKVEVGRKMFGLGETCLICGDPVPFDFYCEKHMPSAIKAIYKEIKVECICTDGWVRTCPVHPMLEESTYLQERAED